jgi:hypothetical protein
MCPKAFVMAVLATSAAVGDGPVRFDVEAEDIRAIRWETATDSAHVALDERATAALRDVTAAHVGRVLEVYVAGIRTLGATVMGTIDSGVITVQSPPPVLRDKLREIDAALKKRKQVVDRD